MLNLKKRSDKDVQPPQRVAIRAFQMAPWLILALLFAGPLAAIGLISDVIEDRSRKLVPSTEEVWVQATAEASLDPTQSKVLIQWADGEHVLAPNWTGMVSEVSEINGVVSTGERVIRIDGLWRLASIFHDGGDGRLFGLAG